MCNCQQGTCPGNCPCGCRHTPPAMTYQQNTNGSWSPATPLGWMEEHNRFQRTLLWLLGKGHCGKRGWRVTS